MSGCSRPSTDIQPNFGMMGHFRKADIPTLNGGELAYTGLLTGRGYDSDVPFADLATYLQERSLCAKGRHRRIGFVKIKNPIFVACQSL